jgi:hypothetical protein
MTASLPIGFLLLMVGFGLRLDTSWQVLAWGFLLAGAATAGVGILQARGTTGSGASVSARSEG